MARSGASVSRCKQVPDENPPPAKMLEELHIDKQSWNVRSITGRFREVVKSIKPVKTIQNLPGGPFRMGIINGNIWIRHSEKDPLTSCTAYNQQLIKLGQHEWQEIQKDINMVQQVSESDVMILADDGLHATDTEGRYQYKVMDGIFSDIAIDTNYVIVIECEKNKVIMLMKKEGRWQSHSHIVVDTDKDLKTLLLQDNNKLLMAIHWSQKILQMDMNSGEILKEFGSGIRSSEVGQFHAPYVVGIDEIGEIIVCDSCNDRLLVLDADGKWHEVKIQGIENPRDIIIIGKYMYVLEQLGCKLSKFQIMSI